MKNKERISEILSDYIVGSMRREDLERVVWDNVFLELLDKDWGDIKSMAEEFSLISTEVKMALKGLNLWEK